MGSTSVLTLIPQQSRYIRNTWMIAANKSLNFRDNSAVRYFNEVEASKLSEMVRKRNIFARHSYENNFYIKRINELSNRTIIEVFRSGDPQEIREDIEEIANQIEKIVLLSATLVVKKDRFLKKLGIHSKHRSELDIIIGSQIQYISSRLKGAKLPDGISITESFRNRFVKCGFSRLYDYCQVKSDLSKRVISSMDWLFESRREPSMHASVVKTSIALETLLIFAESETLGRSLSERVAYILSSDPDVRKRLGKMVLEFYNARSGIVHGNSRRMADKSLIEAIERILVLIYLTISHNSYLWPSVKEFRKWFEIQRWGYPSSHVNRPFPKHYLKNALALCLSKKE